MISSPIRPGRGGKGKGRAFPKGRQLDVVAHQEISELLAGHQPLQRDMLIEYLHLVQDKWGCLSAGHLAALALDMRPADGRSLRSRDFLSSLRYRERR